MKLTHFGHAAVLVETDEGRRALFDPGTYSSGFESLTDLDVILLTHAHPDHVDVARLAALREANPDAVLIANADAAGLADDARPSDRVVVDAEPFEVAGVKVQPTGRVHGVIHPDLPSLANSGFILDDAVWHPGDAFDAEPRSVDVLLLPVGGPWMKVGDAIDFARAVGPRVIVPIHQAGLADVHRQLHYGLLKSLVSSSELVVLDEGVTQDV
jgi:L-ascorbate metabolism protein UlaG (beta-lactamase superfamily)